MKIFLTDLSAEYIQLTSALKSKQGSKNTDILAGSNTKQSDGIKEKGISYIIILISLIRYYYQSEQSFCIYIV